MLAAENAGSRFTPQRPGVAAEHARPVLFLHIPKTAGTSFLLMLQNVFGDNHVRRIHTIDKESQSTIDDIVEHELDEVSCLTGHLPLHLFEKHLGRFQPFTVLREPIPRVLSLFRFLKAGDPAELRRLGLPLDCSLQELLNSRHPEIYGQVNNGMVRLLCGSARMVDSDYPEFWDGAASVRALHLALANLRRIDFGLTAEMEQTLKLAQVKWSIPYPLRQYRENTTSPDAAEEDAACLHQIIMANTADLALYHWARGEFRRRIQSLVEPAAGSGWNPTSVFAPVVDTRVSVATVAGRQGFHEFESIDVSWLHSEQPGEIWFVAREVGRLRFRLRFFCVIPSYPVEDIVVGVNDTPVKHEFTFEEKKWGLLETDYFDAGQGLNRLTIKVPLFVPAVEVDPDSGDSRQLGVALANVMIQSQPCGEY